MRAAEVLQTGYADFPLPRNRFPENGQNQAGYPFLFEAMMISVSGGIIGVVLGITMAFLVSYIADIPTIVSFSSIVLSFGVAASVGLIFGIAPARKAAMQDPITSLRHE